MKRVKWTAFLIACSMPLVLCACESTAATDTSSNSESNAAITQPAMETVTIITNQSGTLKIGAQTQSTGTNVTVKPHYTHSHKVFKLEDFSISLFMENGWEFISGGTATDSMIDPVDSFPAVIQYLDSQNTVTINASETCEAAEPFLSMQEEEYLAEYIAEFDSIEISAFEHYRMKEYDSIRISANVTRGGKDYEMTHILTNDIGGSSVSWMFLDHDGSCKINWEEAISYPKFVESTYPAAYEDAIEKFRR